VRKKASSVLGWFALCATSLSFTLLLHSLTLLNASTAPSHIASPACLPMRLSILTLLAVSPLLALATSSSEGDLPAIRSDDIAVKGQAL
jgi:hypothetical protein